MQGKRQRWARGARRVGIGAGVAAALWLVATLAGPPGTIATPGSTVQAQPPVPIQTQGFWVPGPPPMWVERLAEIGAPRQPYPLILVHGAGQTGAAYQTTPDGREGWASYFARRGFTTYVVDLPGHGRSGQPADFPTWSGLRYVDALQALLQQTGPALVLTHSMGGRVGWKLAERAPDEVVALFAVAPARPPNLVPPAGTPLPEDRPFFLSADFARTYLTNAPAFPQEAWDTFFATIVPESARAVNEGSNMAGPELYVGPDALLGIRAAALVLDYDTADPLPIVRASTDYFGIPLLLADRDWGLVGHGHLPMLERGNLEIAARIADWLEATPARQTASR